MISSIICGIIFAFVIFYEMQKNALQEEYKKTDKKRQLETIHFEEVTKRRRELEIITEENDKTMQNIEVLIANGQIEKAERIIQALLKRIELTREYPYSSIPIVNVVLTQKQKECEQNNIILKLDINLKEKLNIKQTDLCSVFANILDNAIRSCKQMREHGISENAEITLKAGMNRNYLIIRCENPYKKELGKFHEGSGLGLKILTDIAKRYAGDFQTERKDGVFVAQVIMRP